MRKLVLALSLESRGPGIDSFRAGGPKWGRKWPKNRFWPHLKNGGKLDRKMGKMARKSIFEPFSGNFFHFPGHFSHFPGHFSPIFQVRPKSIFSSIFIPIFGPEARNGSIPGPRDSNTILLIAQLRGVPQRAPSARR